MVSSESPNNDKENLTQGFFENISMFLFNLMRDFKGFL